MKLYQLLLRVRPTFVVSFIKKLFRIKREEFNSEKGTFFVDPISNFGTRLMSDSVYEPEMIDTIEKIVKKGDSFFDLGANEGYFSVLSSKIVGRNGKIYAIEPQSRLQNIIEINFKLNSINNGKIIQKAISNKIGKIEFSLTPDTNTGSSGLYNTTKYKNPTETVKMITLEQLFYEEKIKKIKLIKIDIEGLEYEAILGSKKLFMQNIIENIALELHPDILLKRNKSESEIIKFLNDAGYKRNNHYKTLVFSKV